MILVKNPHNTYLDKGGQLSLAKSDAS